MGIFNKIKGIKNEDIDIQIPIDKNKKRTPQENVQLFKEKYLYLFKNSAVLISLIADSESIFDINGLDQFLCSNKEVGKCNIYNIIEHEKLLYDEAEINLIEDQIFATTFLIEQLIKYLNNNIENSLIIDSNSYDDVLEIKGNFLKTLYGFHKKIIESLQYNGYDYIDINDYEYDFDPIVEKEKRFLANQLVSNDFMKAVYINNESFTYYDEQADVIKKILEYHQNLEGQNTKKVNYK